MSGASATVDVSVLASPSQHDSLEEYIQRLLEWKQVLDSSWVSLFMSANALCDLGDANCFPLRPHLARMLTSHGLTEVYDINTVFKLVNVFLTKLPDFESHFCIDEVLFSQCSTEPDVLDVESGDGVLLEHRKRNFMIHALLREHGSVHCHPMIVRYAPCPVIRVKSVLEDIDHCRDDLEDMLSLPVQFEGEVVICHDLTGFIQCLDEAVMLINAEDDEAVEAAINVAVCKRRLLNSEGFCWISSPKFHVGRDFRSSYQVLRCSRELATKILRAVVATVVNEDMANTHNIRVKPSGNAPVRRRSQDNALAWRRDIGTEHHLHYWKLDDGEIEFANVAFPHDDFSISE